MGFRWYFFLAPDFADTAMFKILYGNAKNLSVKKCKFFDGKLFDGKKKLFDGKKVFLMLK